MLVTDPDTGACWPVTRLWPARGGCRAGRVRRAGRVVEHAVAREVMEEA